MGVDRLAQLEVRVALQQFHQHRRRPRWLFGAQGDGRCQDLWRKGADRALIGAGLGAQSVKAACPVERQIAAQGRNADAAAAGVRNLVRFAGDLAQARLQLAGVFGDEEFSPSYRILFDANTRHHLPTDTCAIIGSTLTRRLIKGYNPAK